MHVWCLTFLTVFGLCIFLASAAPPPGVVALLSLAYRSGAGVTLRQRCCVPRGGAADARTDGVGVPRGLAAALRCGRGGAYTAKQHV